MLALKRSRRRRPLTLAKPVQIALVAGIAVVTLVLVVAAFQNQPRPVEAAPSPTGSVANLVEVAVVGDSYSGGSEMDSGASARWPSLLAESLGFRERVVAQGGVGYVTASADGINFAELAARIPGEPDVIVVFGSRNDSQGYETVREAAATTFDLLKAREPQAQILVIGPPWVNAAPPISITSARDATRDAAAAANITYVDPLNEGWFANSGGIGSDGIHPDDDGHALLAEWIRPHLEPLIPAE